MVARGEVWQVTLDPVVGSEIQKTRPCLIVSPDDLNAVAPRFIIAPLTTGSRPAPFRVPIAFGGKQGLVLLDQVRCVDRARLSRRLGVAEPTVLTRALTVLRGMFET
jgi:mRNA interferase MazF